VSKTSTVGSDDTAPALLQWLDEVAAQGIFTTDRALVVRTWNRWLERRMRSFSEAAKAR
jgi:hypothetical protein